MPTVSVIIPAFNQSHYVGEAIASVLAQTFQDYEIIVVDDGSADNTRQVVESFGRAHYIFQDNRGESGARNTGIRHATGRYVAFLDADDTFLPGKLESQVPILDARPEIGAVFADVYLCDAKGRPEGLLSAQIGDRGKASGQVFEALVHGNFLAVNSVLIRREILHQVGMFDESIRAFPDWDLWLRVAAQYAFFYLDMPVANYRVHGNMVSRDQERMWQGALAVRRKLMAMPSFLAASPDARAYGCYHLGLLNCLVGDMTEGRRYLVRSFRQASSRNASGAALLLSLLGRKALQAAVAWRAKRKGWLNAV